ncbi:MotA/TolQ/ExbB proton channel family protein [Marinibactrum halimedae]|uniref:TonB2 energy transduction system inner membrane component ExbB n=1 Tax=Marinibactrum halimedae TaxID=1444977 RepID=A0AA37T1Y9_9GAMM|nr:MotA/TolQ/ExbB proton channel family protein [Marinibactrum halimedae]MCD9458775.1 MotA/TolQ/ExbB proton channel family protein [Marinibactrum halimedae]GLS25334.1 TonB2 energy transduction system inner membrane component ExbB [Marinibactrum halimedae]
MTDLMDYIETIKAFVESGGVVLIGIAILTFFMWTLIFERIWYFKTSLGRDVKTALDQWEARGERKSWNAHQVRYALISRVSERVNVNLDMIGTLVSLAPLLGLLGTVTGMIDVFNVLAVTGGGDAKSMAGGVSKATIPTMAGMVAALSGVFGNTYITQTAQREKQLLEDHLTMDH